MSHILAQLGTPEGFGMAEGCVHVKPYNTGEGPDAYHVNANIERNNTRYHAEWNPLSMSHAERWLAAHDGELDVS